MSDETKPRKTPRPGAATVTRPAPASPAARRPSPRRGATTVEFALVCSVFFLFLFGVFEYCRYLVLLQGVSNAARDAARFASVNVNNLSSGPQPSIDFRGTQITDFGYPAQGVAGYPSTQPVFTVPAVKAYLLGPYDSDPNNYDPTRRLILPQGRLAGIQQMLSPVASGAELVQVYPCDPVSLYADPPTFAPRTQPQTVNGVLQPAVWNRAQFGERIAVRVTATYTPVLPSFLKMDAIRRLDIVAVMGSEG